MQRETMGALGVNARDAVSVESLVHLAGYRFPIQLGVARSLILL